MMRAARIPHTREEKVITERIERACFELYCSKHALSYLNYI